jgi:REP element-mobilizing transposase RayT
LRFLQGAGVCGITEAWTRLFYDLSMPAGLRRYYGTGHFHFITCSCYGRQARLGTARRRDLFLRIPEDARQKYRFVVVGYVAMPEHFHLLMSEPQVGDPSKAMQVVKQRFAQQVLETTSAGTAARMLLGDSAAAHMAAKVL